MPAYIKDYVKLLKDKGERAFLEALRHPMLVMLGLARQLREGPSGEKTTVATAVSDELEVSSLVGRLFFVTKAVSGAPGPISLGRTADTDLHIPEYSISKHHCAISPVDGAFAIRDTGSTNGTEVDGVKLTPGQDARLRGGETIVLGRFAFRFDTPTSLLERLRPKT